MKQSELIKQMTDKELKKQVILSQLIFITIGVILSVFLFEKMSDWLLYFNWNPIEIFYYGAISGLIIVGIDLIIMYIFPERYYDDGGINEKLFKNLSIADIFCVTLIIVVSEEILFRGLVQTTFGYVFASVLFALMHIRYLKKPVLLISVLLISFYIGYLFELTGNLYVTITSHFVVDFLLGLLIVFRNRGASNGKQ